MHPDAQRTADANAQTHAKIGPKYRKPKKKEGACEGSGAGHVHAPQTCAAICDLLDYPGWKSFDSADTYADKGTGPDIMSVCVCVSSVWRSRWRYQLNIP